MKTLRMPTSAKAFLVVMFGGFLAGVAQFVLTGIVLALFTIGTVLGFQH